MTANTPIYGFTYPCPGEVVDPAAFALLAGQIDTKLNDVNNDWILDLNRYNVDISSSANQTITNGVDTVLTTPQYTFPISGVWIVSAQVFNQSTPVTLNSMRARLRINATARFGMTTNPEAFAIGYPQPTVPMVAVAGDVASITFFYNGSGTMDVNANLQAKLLCRIA